MRRLFADHQLILTGEKHGTVAVVLHGKPYEMTTYRLDGNYHDHRHPDAVQFVDDLPRDLVRADFTNQRHGYAPGRGIIDLYGGRDDLAAGMIRCVGDPAQRFAEDALRILRALRFSARLGFALDEATAAAALQARDTLQSVSAERIYTEIDGLLGAPNAGPTLAKYGEILAGAVPKCRPASAAPSPAAGIATMCGSTRPWRWKSWTCAARIPAARGCCAGQRFCTILLNPSAAAWVRTVRPTLRATTSGARRWPARFCAA